MNRKMLPKLWMTGLTLCFSALSMASPSDVSRPVDAIPSNIVTTANKPMMMLVTTKDHTVFNPAYTDFEDLDEDGVIDVTYKPRFKYYGYFDSAKCYEYKSALGYFEPKIMAVVTDGRYVCPSTQRLWSGNFLNWSSMTRLDIVRKMLYGGKRSTDTLGETILERAWLAQDSHSFTKYYRGSDIRDYTPFSVSELTKSTGTNAGIYSGLTICSMGAEDNPTATPILRMVVGNYRLWSTVEGRVCQWIEVGGRGVFNSKLPRYYPDPAEPVANRVQHEANLPSSTQDKAVYPGVSSPDLVLRVKACVPTLLGEERCQPFPADSTSNYKPYGVFQEFAYPSASSTARVEMGLLTGSYDRNLTAGALRKNMGDFQDEINPLTGVFCHSPSAGCPATLADGRGTTGGAIKSIDAFRLDGRGAFPGEGGYGSNAWDWGIMAEQARENGKYTVWGNPLGEMLVQALQYFAGVTSTNPTTVTRDSALGLPVVAWQDPLSNENIDRRSTFGNSICRPLNVLALSGSGLSFDAGSATPFRALPNRTGGLDSYVNKIGNLENITGTKRFVGSVSGAATWGVSCTAKNINNLFDVSGICPESPGMGGTYQMAGAAYYANTSRIRNYSQLPSDFRYQANALKVKTLTAALSGGVSRIEVPIPNTSPQKFVYLTPESLFDFENGKATPAALLTFASIYSGERYGAFVVTWNDKLIGGDYDMDITGYLRYDVLPNPQSPSGWDIKVTTDIINVGTGVPGIYGFNIVGVKNSGQSADGRYLTHQHLNDRAGGKIIESLKDDEGYLCRLDSYRNRTNSNGTTFDGTVCRVAGNNFTVIVDQNYPVENTFNMVGVDNVVIQDPLWYAAKYGGFESSVRDSTGIYTDVTEPGAGVASWDRQGADGSVGSDGVPDNYFFARRPEVLERQLRRALDVLAKDSNASPAVAGQDFYIDDFKYVPAFDGTTVSGTVEAYQLDSDGNFGSAFKWEAGAKLWQQHASSAGSQRNIITNHENGSAAAIPFRWASLPTDYISRLKGGLNGLNRVNDANARRTVNYIRGDQSLEGLSGLRERGTNLLGPIVNGTPMIQSPPNGIFQGEAGSGYRAFYNTYRNRAKVLWVPSNDGMLHAFNPQDGSEIFAYIPGVLANRLSEIPMQRGDSIRTRVNNENFIDGTESPPPSNSKVWSYVDGSPFSADVKVSGNWRTYVFGSLGRGDRALYALDATNPGNLTESNARDIFKWQFTSDHDNDIGYMVGDVSRHPATNQASPVAALNHAYPPATVGERPKPRFALLLGNGYKSTNGKAALFIVYVDGPDSTGLWANRYKKIVLDEGPDNGLSSVRWEDIDGNGTADVVYAGDLKGNLWKIDISSSNPDQWGSAFRSNSTNKPLYQATYNAGTVVAPQIRSLPITSTPELMYMGRGGVMVNFGTGSAFNAGDFPALSATQRVYGIWDRPGLGTASGRSLPVGTATLAARTLMRDSVTGIVTVTSSTPLNWSTHDGWYFNLPTGGEAVLSDPSLDAGVLSFVSVRPRSNADNCNNTPAASLYMIDPISGRTERNSLGTVNIEGVNVTIAAKDIRDQKVKVVAERSKRKDSRTCRAGEPGCTCVGSVCTKETAACASGQSAFRVTGRSTDEIICYSTSPRLQWREIPGLRTDR